MEMTTKKITLELKPSDSMEALIAIIHCKKLASAGFNVQVYENIARNIAKQMSEQLTKEEVYEISHECNINGLLS